MADNTKQQADQSIFVFVKDTNTNKIRRVAIPSDVQIGLQGNPAELQLLGRLSLSATDYSVTAVNKGVLYVDSNDTIVSVTLVNTPASGRITVYLPANPRNGQLHFIKDMSGTADSVPIDVVPPNGVLIDQYESRTLSDTFGSLAIYWYGDRWHILVSGVGAASSPAAGDATYLTLSSNSTLTNERRLNLSGTNLSLVDQGANASAIIDLTQVLGASAGTYSNATVTADAYGRITAISSGTADAPNNASYITISNEALLTSERRLVVSTGLRLVDCGSNNQVILSTPWTETATHVISTSSVTVGPGITRLGVLSGPAFYITSSNQIGLMVDGPGTGIGSGIQIRPIGRTFWELLATGDTADQDGPNKFNIRNLSLVIDCFTIRANGDIGIKNVNPRSALDVNGDVTVSGPSGSTNTLYFTSPTSQTKIARVANDLKFFDVYNAAGLTLSELRGKADVSASYVTIGNTGSLPNERALTAGAGISITDGGAGSTVTISATGATSAADVSGSYVLIGNTGSLPNERALTAGTGISITDNGPNSTVVISATGGGSGADVSASYVIIGGNTGSLPNERSLVAGVGISITDNGPDGTVVINATGSGSGGGSTIVTGSAIFGQAGYQGYTSSSVFWSATGSWTAFTGALSNYTDVVTVGLARTGSVFQVLNGGLYYFHASFNAYGSDAYVSLRLRNTNTNFVALQRSTYRSTPADQNLVTCEGVLSAAVGDTWQLEYVSSGSIFPWTSSNPTPDSTNMRTGEVSMFLLPSAGPTGSAGLGSNWLTALDINFSTLGSQTITTGSNTIGGFPWLAENVANSDAFAIVPGDGLRIDTNATNTDNYLTTHNGPLIKIRFSDVIPNFNLSDYEIRAWAEWDVFNADANFEIALASIERTNWVSNQNYSFRSSKGFNNSYSSTVFRNVQLLNGSTDNVAFDLSGSSGSNNLTVFHMKNVREVTFFSGRVTSSYSSANSVALPSAASLNYLGSAIAKPASVFDDRWVSGSGDLSFYFATLTGNTNNTFSASLQRLRIEYR